MELGNFDRFSKKPLGQRSYKLHFTVLDNSSEEWFDILTRPETAFYCLVFRQFSRCRWLTILSSKCLPYKCSVGIRQVLSLESSNPLWMWTSVSLAHMWVGLAEWKMMSISPGGSLPDNDTASRSHQVYLPKLFFVLPLLYFLVHWRLVYSIAVELVLTACAWIILLKAFSCSRAHSAIFAICWKHGRINSSTSGTPQLWLLKSIDEYSAHRGCSLVS